MAAGTKSSLSQRFSFALIAVVFLILLAFSTFAILFNVQQNKTELDTRAKNLAGFASVSVASAVWNLDEVAVAQVGDALALNDSFAFVNILSEDEAIFTKIDEQEKLKTFEEFSKSTNYTTTSADVSHDGEKIGKLNLALSRKALRKQLISEVAGIIALLAIIVAAISVTSLTITRRYIFQPLSELETSATVIAEGNLDEPVSFKSDDEIGVLAKAFDGMRGSLKQRLQDLDEAREQLEEYSRTLEQRVEERTSELQEKNGQLEDAFEALKQTQSQLLESEKMAALGGLVAGVAHEINTPVGIGVTAASHLQSKTREFADLVTSGKIKRSDLGKFLEIASQSSELLLSNLNRAAELIQSFKQVAVDQSSEKTRKFGVKDYFNEILRSLHPQIKKTSHTIEVNCDESLSLNSYPGAFSQLITNLVMNSIIHAYEKGDEGKITIDVSLEGNQVVIKYSDDGKGIPKENLDRIFEPFFTTRRNQGGSGLGMHIVYNLVVQKLQGKIVCESEVGTGTTFLITIPHKNTDAESEPCPMKRTISSFQTMKTI